MRQHLIVVAAFLTMSTPLQAQQGDSVVPASINRFCHPPDDCAMRGGVVWDSSNAIPRYPEVMRSVGVQGEASLRFSVLRDGTVDSTSIVIARISNNIFAQVTRNAARTWKFRVVAGDPPASIPMSLDVMFLLVNGCATANAGPMHALVTSGETPRLLVLACRESSVTRH